MQLKIKKICDQTLYDNRNYNYFFNFPMEKQQNAKQEKFT